MFKLPLAALLAFAFSATAEDFPKPTINKIAGAPVTATWPSGNVAELKLNRNSLVRIKAPFQVTENLCGGGEGHAFYLFSALRVDRMRWIWSQHKDPSKQGQQVNFRGSTDSPFEFMFLIANPGAMFLPEIKTGFPRDVLEIADASWLPALNIESWTVEAMRKNPQTGVSENRVILDVAGAHLARENDSRLRLDALDSYASFGFAGILPLVGDVVSWTFDRSGGKCTISMKPDLGEVNRQIKRYAEDMTNDFVTYNWEQDGLSQIADDNFLLFDFLEYADD